ncbi:MAG: OmpW/AlkL family protein [Methylophilaceae bacterium]
MKRTILATVVTFAFLPTLASAEAGDWVVRVRAVDVSPNEDSKLGSTVNNLGLGAIMSPSAELAVDSNVIPELDISYYITKNISAELILAIGTRHDVSVKGDALGTVGNQDLGSVNVLPPTLTAQWHFNPDQTIDPYIGAGLNYTHSFDRSLKFSKNALAGNDIRVDSNMFGVVAQAGVDINLKDGWLINADVKYITMNTDVEARLGAGNTGAWTKIDDLDINPWVFGIGIGKKF